MRKLLGLPLETEDLDKDIYERDKVKQCKYPTISAPIRMLCYKWYVNLAFEKKNPGYLDKSKT